MISNNSNLTSLLKFLGSFIEKDETGRNWKYKELRHEMVILIYLFILFYYFVAEHTIFYYNNSDS